MEVTQQQEGQYLVMQVQGRLDGTWADHLADHLNEVVRAGNHHIRLDLSRTSYLSSAGIRVLLMFFKQLKNLAGELQIHEPSEVVREVLELSGLDSLFRGMRVPAVAAPAPPKELVREIEHPKASIQLFDLDTRARLSWESHGVPDRLPGCQFAEADCKPLSLSPGSFALGLGALGTNFEECRDRFGEFLGTSGAVASQPADGAPDYLLAQGAFVPEIKTLYGLSFRGSWAHQARFQVKPDHRSISLSDLVSTTLDVAGSDSVGLVMIAEIHGLVGASMRRSPVAGAKEGTIFQHPGIRDWLSFTTERAYHASTALVVGVAGKQNTRLPGAFVRPLCSDGPLAHVHAAVFTYAPLAKGKLDLAISVGNLFQNARLQAVLHLLGDDRGIAGIGQSEFIRGACWFGPMDSGAK